MLGDSVQAALEVLGITDERVTRLLGFDCGCDERRQYLNRLGTWASRVLQGRVARAREYLQEILQDYADEPTTTVVHHSLPSAPSAPERPDVTNASL